MPYTVTSPELGFTRAFMCCTNVLFPLPVSPIKVINSPLSLISKLISFNALKLLPSALIYSKFTRSNLIAIKYLLSPDY